MLQKTATQTGIALANVEGIVKARAKASQRTSDSRGWTDANQVDAGSIGNSVAIFGIESGASPVTIMEQLG